MGKRTLNWVQAERIIVRVKNTRTGKTAEIRPTPALMDLLGSFKSKATAGTGHRGDERLEAIARKIAGMGEKEVGEVRVDEESDVRKSSASPESR